MPERPSNQPASTSRSASNPSRSSISSISSLERKLHSAVRTLREARRRYPRLPLIVSISGGKDSTAALEATRLAFPGTVDARAWHKEAESPETVAFLSALAEQPGIDLEWRAWPTQENDCRQDQAFWYPFDPAVSPDLWMHLPPAIASRRARRIHAPIHLIEAEEANAADGILLVDGRRTGENATRSAFLSRTGPIRIRAAKRLVQISPLHDWTNADVWKAHTLFDWPINPHYQRLDSADVPRERQRCGALHGLEVWRAYPSFRAAWGEEWWTRMNQRFPGLDLVEAYRRNRPDPFADARAPADKWAVVQAAYQRLPPDRQRLTRKALNSASRAMLAGRRIDWPALYRIVEHGDAAGERQALSAYMDATRRSTGTLRGPRTAQARARSLAKRIKRIERLAKQNRIRNQPRNSERQ